MRNPILVRSLAACIAVALPALGAGACGSSKVVGSTGSAQVATASRGSAVDASVRDTDGDNDSVGSHDDPDNDIVMTFGHAGDPADLQAVRALIGNYYKAAAAGDGRRACSLVYWLYAETTVAEHHGKGPRSTRGDTCARIATETFRLHRREIVEDVRGFDLIVLRVGGKRGVARVRFGAYRERLVPVELDRGKWRMNTLLDNGAP